MTPQEIDHAGAYLKYLADNAEAETKASEFLGTFEGVDLGDKQLKYGVTITRLLEDEGLVEVVPPSKYSAKITAKGIRAYRIGYKNWLIQEAQKKELEEKRAEETRKATEVSTSAAKVSAGSAAISAALTLVSVLFGVYQYINSNSQDKKIDSLQTRVTSLESNRKSIIVRLPAQVSTPQKSSAHLKSEPILQKQKK
ncbi:hypothetical protein [Spirosoma sp.]|uniref:hypothetical protein n=1 Tax=Spirosoma sp. TaxID=1899569 RepID=UPI00262D49D7|nr:hypothetical protein [Spirosoma sp.]MCX6215348.1 hypothetical protein [Spirosoma sp.]